MEQRIDAVLDYAFNDQQCRETRMLRYFGEQTGDSCGHCDVCIDRRKRENTQPADVQSGILYMAQVKPRRLEEFFHTLSFPKDEIVSMVAFLVDEGYLIHRADDTYHNPQPLD